MITKAQKMIATVAMLAITATAAPVTANAAYHTTYTDVTPNDWFYSDVMTLSGQGVVNGVGTSVGYTISIILLAGIRERIEGNDIPYSFQGSPIVLVTAGLMAIAFFGFSGLL